MHHSTSVTRRAFVAGLAGACLPACARLFGIPEGGILRVLIGSAPGSNYDRTARLLANPLRRQFPDRHLVLVNNDMAGGRLMAKTLTEAPADGSTIGYLQSGLIYAELLREPGIAFELTRFRWLAGVTSERRTLLASTGSGIHTIEQLLASPHSVNVSATVTGSPSYVAPLLVNAMLGTRLRPIPGYASGAREGAVATGEVEGIVASFGSAFGLIAAGAAIPLLRMSRGPAPDELRDVPALADLIDLSRWRGVLDLIEAHDDFGRCVAAPPGTPDDHVLPLRQAFATILADPEVIASAARAGLLIEAAPGDAIAARLDRLFDGSSGRLSDRLQDALACGRRLAAGQAGC